MMMHRGMIVADHPSPSRVAEVVELRLLVPVDQLAALEAAAGRLEQTVGALIRQAVHDFLQDPTVVGFMGEVAGRPPAPQFHNTEGFP